MPSALLAHDLVRTYGERTVLDGVSLVAAPGLRSGLIGENGAGKAALLRLLAGVEEPDSGTVERPADLGFIAQELHWPASATLSDAVDDALREARAAVRELDDLAPSPADPAAASRYGELLEWAQDHDAWDADRTPAGLGLSNIPRDRRLGTLSGGQRSRVGLAALPVRRPAALLLDEPTNHLDDAAAEFREASLRGLPGAVILASHDRAFLDAVCADVVDLDPAPDGPTRFGGGWSGYPDGRRAARARWEQRHADEQDELAELRRSVAVTARAVAPGRSRGNQSKLQYDVKAGGRAESQVSRRVRNARRRLDELDRDQVRRPPQPLRFAAVLGFASTGPAAALRDVHVPGRLRVMALDVGARDRILVTGANGAGKSTLLEVLAGRIAAEGAVHRRRGLRVGRSRRTSRRPRGGRPGRCTSGRPGCRLCRSPSWACSLRAMSTARSPTCPSGSAGASSWPSSSPSPRSSCCSSRPTTCRPRWPTSWRRALGSRPGAVVVASHDRWLRRRWSGRVVALDTPPSHRGNTAP